MAVHRISDRAELLLQRLAAAEAKKPAQLLSELIIDYAAGLAFADDSARESLQASKTFRHPTRTNPPRLTIPRR
jgi:hypothetical protein